MDRIWFDIVQTIGIVASILLARKASRDQARQVEVSNALLITQHHRELWSQMLEHRELARVFDPAPDLVASPITEQERLFTNMLFLHTAGCLRASKAGVAPAIEGIEADLADIFSFPIPRQVWSDVHAFHEKEFSEFVSRIHAGWPVSPRPGVVPTRRERS